MKQREQKFWNREESSEGIAQPTRVPGLNDNLEFMGRQIHIQTESAGFPEARIVTQVFSKGKVLFSRKTDYAAADDSGGTARIQELMNSQHIQVIKEIKDKQARILDSR